MRLALAAAILFLGACASVPKPTDDPVYRPTKRIEYPLPP